MNPNNENYNDRFIILKKASIRPDKIVFYNQFVKRSSLLNIEVVDTTTLKKNSNNLIIEQKIKQPSANTHNYEISKKASSRIKEKISWLYNLSKNQTITTHNGKVLYSFKMNFITLTLPSVQKHSSDIITKECLNQFITECAAKFGLKNYVWRLEFQKNGNIHYHLACDTYIEFWKCTRIWNRVINKLGYVDSYAQKFSKYDFKDYYNEFHKNGKEDYSELMARFKRGVDTNWSQPNTVDCRNVTSSKNIGYYIAKYITKNSTEPLNNLVYERDKTVSNMRLWFCSRSLSKLSKIEIFLEEVNTVSDTILEELKDFKRFVFDYCEVIYFNTKDQSTLCKQSLWLLFSNYAKDNFYFT
jgi:hypothetical protein